MKALQTPHRVSLAFASLVATGLFCLSTQIRAGEELIPNDRFADDGASWKVVAAKELNATMLVEKVGGEPALCVEVRSPDEDEPSPDNIPVAFISRPCGEIDAGGSYHITFQAKAEKEIAIVSFIRPENEHSRILWRTDLKIDPEWREFNYSFTASDSASHCDFGFSRLGNTSNKYWFKDVVVTKE